MPRRIARFALAAPLLLGLLGFVASACGGSATGSAIATATTTQAARTATVVVLPATGIVDSVLAGYLAEGIAGASRDGAAAVVIRLNTPGGSLDATSRIVSTLLEAPLPVSVWVAPSGARAASAGTFITLAANVAVMAPGTNIGAATPVGGQGEDIPGALGQKVLNDSVASIRSIAETRGRNADWAEQAVRNAKSSPASEALAQHAIDGTADTIESVIAFVDGRTTTVRGQPTTIHTAMSLKVLASKPRATQRRSAIHAATRTPTASSRP